MAKKNVSQQPPNADPNSNTPPPPEPGQKLFVITSPNATFTGRRNLVTQNAKVVTVIFHEGKSQPVGEEFAKTFCGKYKMYGREPAAADAIPGT